MITGAILLSASLLALGASFIFAKTPNANAESSSDIVIRITNQGDGAINDIWDSPVNYSSSNPGCLASGTLNAQASVDLGNCAVGDTIIISESVPGVSFRQWNGDNYSPLFSSNNNVEAVIDSMPAMNAFTTDSTGETAGDNFFLNFNRYGALTSLPAGSFDTSKITTIGSSFFGSFNSSGALTSLPAGSFDTSNITTAGNYFFYGFNFNGKLTKSNTGIPIKNVSSNPVNFQSWNGASSDTDTVNSGNTFEFYAVNAWNYTINADSGNLTGGTVIGVIDEGTLVQLPTTATRAGYTFAGFTSNAWTGTKNLGETFTLTGDTEITATWIKNSDPTPNPTPNPDNGGQTPAAPNTGSTNKIAGATISSLIFASIIAAVALFAKFAHKTLKSER